MDANGRIEDICKFTEKENNLKINKLLNTVDNKCTVFVDGNVEKVKCSGFNRFRQESLKANFVISLFLRLEQTCCIFDEFHKKLYHKKYGIEGKKSKLIHNPF